LTELRLLAQNFSDRDDHRGAGMAPLIEQRQPARLAHRMNFWGRPSAGGTISWRYQGQTWVVERPDDGQPALRRSVVCEVCDTSLTYLVHSVQAARDRQRRWRIITYVGAALILPGFLGFSFLDNGLISGIAAVALVVGIMSAFCFGQVAAKETGISGNLNSWPGATKHAVTLDPSGQVPDLVCPRCGHAEEFGPGSVYRDGYPQTPYEIAKPRFDAHDCPTP
jgi:hypothetical protein